MIKIYIITFFVICAAVTPIYVMIRRPRRFEPGREWVRGLFFVYVAALLVLTLNGYYRRPSNMIASAIDRIKTGYMINLKPGRMIGSMYKAYGREVFDLNVTGNIVIFIPWGTGLLLLWENNRRFFKFLVMCPAISCFIEFCQLFIMRSCDVDDIILNTAGGLLGGLIYLVLTGIFPGLKKLGRSRLRNPGSSGDDLRK